MNDSEIDNLKAELDHEKSCREAAAWQNSDFEKQIVSVQEELRKGEYTWDHDEDLKQESSRHKQLLEGIDQLRAELPIWKEKLKNAKVCGPDCKLKHDDLNINLDILTPAELLRTVKRFERIKTDLISTLRSKEWRLDSESKLFVRVNDQRTYLQNELLICQNNIMRLQRNGSYWQWQCHCSRIKRNNIILPSHCGYDVPDTGLDASSESWSRSEELSRGS